MDNIRFKPGQVLYSRSHPTKGGIKILYRYPPNSGRQQKDPLYKVKFLNRKQFNNLQNLRESVLKEILDI